MTVLDPENLELEALLRHVELKGRRVLELGSGDGRLTWRYAHLPALLVCREPDEEVVRSSRSQHPAGLPTVELGVARAEALDLPDEAFEVAIFSWSL